MSVGVLVSPFAGWALDTYGPFWPIAITATACSVGCLIRGIATSATTLFAGAVISPPHPFQWSWDDVNGKTHSASVEGTPCPLRYESLPDLITNHFLRKNLATSSKAILGVGVNLWTLVLSHVVNCK